MALNVLRAPDAGQCALLLISGHDVLLRRIASASPSRARRIPWSISASVRGDGNRVGALPLHRLMISSRLTAMNPWSMLTRRQETSVNAFHTKRTSSRKSVVGWGSGADPMKERSSGMS